MRTGLSIPVTELGARGTVAAYSLAAVIALAPLPFGSTDLPVIAVWVAILAAALMLMTGRPASRRDAMFAVLFVCIAFCWISVLGLQISGETIFGLSLANPIWQTSNELLGVNNGAFVTAARTQPLLSAGAHIVFGLALVCGYYVGQNRSAARMLLKTFAASGLIYAIYGILSLIITPDHVLWLEKTAYRNVLTSTFINRNTASVYFGCSAIAWLMLTVEQIERSVHPEQRSLRKLFDHASLLPARSIIGHVLGLMLVTAAAFMTGSRAGAILSLVALLGTIATYYRRSLTTFRATVFAALVSIVVALALLQLLGGQINQRIEVGGLSDAGRLQTYASTFRLIQDYPWLGTGLGTFRWVYPAYRSGDISIVGIWDHAHNTTMELAAEMGLPFTALVALVWLILLFTLARGMVIRRRDRILPTASFWCALLAVVHSQADFSLQIPGFSIVVAAIMGMGIAQSAPSGSSCQQVSRL